VIVKDTRDDELDGDALPSSTRAWVEAALGAGASIVSVERLKGGWSSEMRLLRVSCPSEMRSLVLRSFTKPFFVRHAEGLLNREAAVLVLLAASPIPVASVIAVDARGEHCAFPSLLRTHLPGCIQLADDDRAAQRVDRLAELLVKIHRLSVADPARPRSYQPWTRHDLVRIPEQTRRPEVWARAVDVIRRPAPPYDGCFLHRDFHPGNVLFELDGEPDHGAGAPMNESGSRATPRVSGVVDWVETSWGPADLDVAHCSTALTLLHGAQVGLQFAERYVAAGGKLAADPGARLYWYLLDALAYSPDAEKLVVAWRESGRPDLTQEVVAARLEDYVVGLIARFG
jgi:hypothetical protein